jgi:high frequency lysogenization protein
MKDKNLALAGVFQASELVRQAAWHGTWSGYAATACLNSLFKLEADSAAEIYGGREHMKLGVETMLAVLQGENRYVESLRYTVGLLQIERKFRRARKLQQRVGTRLQDIAGHGGDLPQQNQRTVDWVRTLLLAGLRSATLWRQLGGGRFELMFGRQAIIREARAFLMS